MIREILYFLQVAAARAYVRVIGAQREMSWFIGDTLLPFLTVAAYVYVYKAMNAPPEYTGFVILGGIVVTFWMHMIWSMGMQFFWEKEMGNLERYLMAPLSRPALLLGMAVGGIVMTSTRALTIFLVSYFWFDIRFDASDPLLALAISLATLLALYGMGMMMSSLFFLAGRGIYYGMQIFAEPIFFLGGFYFPVRQLGMITATAAATIIPVTLGLDALRQTMLGVKDARLILFSPETELMWLLAMGAVFVYISIILLGKMETLGRREGKLFLKNQ